MELPASLSNHAFYQAEYLKKLNQLPYYNLAAPIIEDFLRKIIDAGAFYIRVHARDLATILETGVLKNMLETGTGATTGGPEVRLEANEALFGIDSSKLQPNQHPKYGYLSHPDPWRDSLINAGFCYQYGSVIIKLKKEELIHRTTISFGDSVNFGRFRFILPTRTNNVKATCLCGPAVPLDKYATAMLPLRNPLDCYVYVATRIAEGKLTVDNFSNIDRILGDQIPFFEHIELHYHGPLDIATCAEGLYCTAPEGEEKEAIEKAKPLAEKYGMDITIV